MKKATRSISSKEITRERHLLDAEGQVLGRLATKVAVLLMGKSKVKNVPYLDQGDFVTVKNASKVLVTGKKFEQKRYYLPTRRQGKLYYRSFRQQMAKDPRRIIERAVWGMLPKTKQGRKMIARLRVEA